ncbi:MAG: TRAP transporter fused permease subunit [Candidatus Poribacteria bacterium]|nr:TRAP transporter fused permease subunit [Candidatus Poribacteria bacterium]MDE0503254.1 TRAP transporter fused permease subunit [Candidatus Poribacteria bacterium]
MTSLQRLRQTLFKGFAVILGLFVLVEVNYPHLLPQSQLALFAMLGLVLVFLKFPSHSKLAENTVCQWLDLTLAFGAIVCFGYVLAQSEPLLRGFWIDDQPLGNRAGNEQSIDYMIGLLGLVLVLEATRRAIGLTLPLLCLAFLLYAVAGQSLPGWLIHRGHSWERVVSQTFLHSQGVFGVALKVMFTYVFLFVLFGTVLEKTGATHYIIGFARRMFRKSVGGPAKVAVISSGMMGSLSGSAVANTATTGTFTIPMMRSAGFQPTTAAGIEAAASSGGALVPPIMGAGAYMMLEIVSPPVTYLQIIKAALIPALLYYGALLLIVHFRAKLVGAAAEAPSQQLEDKNPTAPGLVFCTGFCVLILFLVLGYTPFRAVTWGLIAVLVLSVFSRHTRMGLRELVEAIVKAAHGGVSLIAAASCVGLILGVVLLTGIGTKLPGMLIPLAQNNLIFALLLLMISTIVLGMGLPSSVCYLLMATLVGSVLTDLGLVPLAAHLFIFYFGMMSMVTPPVALAAYTAGAIANANIMRTGFAAFRFALVGFALPYAFVLRPELLTLSSDGGTAGIWPIVGSVGITALGIVPLAASVAGFLMAPLALWQRLVFFATAMGFILVRSAIWLHLPALGVVVAIGILNWRSSASMDENPQHREGDS